VSTFNEYSSVWKKASSLTRVLIEMLFAQFEIFLLK